MIHRTQVVDRKWKLRVRRFRRRLKKMVSRCGVRQKISQHFIPSHYVRRRFPSFIALEFPCSREVSLVNQKLTFDERISWITRHHNFSPRRHPVVSLQVAPFLRDCKGRGYSRDHRADRTELKTNEFIAIGFELISNRDCRKSIKTCYISIC